MQNPNSRFHIGTAMSKKSSIAIILILTVSSFVIVPTASSEVSKPAIPEFTVKFVDRSYDIPPSYTTNPYNGQRETAYYGDHIYNKTLEITINNQPFTPSGDVNLYYNFRYKGVYEQSWHEAFGVPCDGMTPDGGNFRIQNYGAPTTFVGYTLPWDTPSTGKIEVQVQAMIGTPIVSSNCRIIFSEYSYGFNGEKSAWSNTQTIDLSSGQVTVTQSVTTPTPVQPTPSISATAEPTINPTKAPSPSTQVLPTQTSSEAASQPNTQTNVNIGVDWKDLALTAALILIAILVVVLVLSRRKRR
jgi:hypothetical protein